MDNNIVFAPVESTKPYRCPVRHYNGDCGYDLSVIDSLTIPPHSYANIPHNIVVALPPGTWGMLVGRSSSFVQKGLMVVTGIIDNGYRGELSVMVYNTKPEPVTVEMYERIAQLIVMPLSTPSVMMETDKNKLPDSDGRGVAGFGSTDTRQPKPKPQPQPQITNSWTTEYQDLLDNRWTRNLPHPPEWVCLCGSTRFWKEFMEINLQLTVAGYIVLSIGCNMKSDDEEFKAMSEEEKEEVKRNLDALHKHKIAVADYVVIINKGGYIGASTRSERDYAKSLGKRIIYLYS